MKRHEFLSFRIFSPLSLNMDNKYIYSIELSRRPLVLLLLLVGRCAIPSRRPVTFELIYTPRLCSCRCSSRRHFYTATRSRCSYSHGEITTGKIREMNKLEERRRMSPPPFRRHIVRFSRGPRSVFAQLSRTKNIRRYIPSPKPYYRQ